MFSGDQYTLLDFGAGRKLERWGGRVLDRPAPAVAESPCGCPEVWTSAAARFVRRDANGGVWTSRQPLPTTWHVSHAAAVFELRPASSGALGVFPEQAENWDWIDAQVRRGSHHLRVLNLFAYTGGSTFAAASAGAEVVHVDAARSAVSWARHNAALSQLERAPIRWVVEDARKFVARELRRGNAYDAVILDPPTYGHGPRSEPWEILSHLRDLLCACGQLTRQHRRFMLLTCHTPTLGPAALQTLLADAICGGQRREVSAHELVIRTPDGRALPCGVVARWCSNA
jgi:23S rRNA (cytosine1962-C5)-methyltransferase